MVFRSLRRGGDAEHDILDFASVAGAAIVGFQNSIHILVPVQRGMRQGGSYSPNTGGRGRKCRFARIPSEQVIVSRCLSAGRFYEGQTWGANSNPEAYMSAASPRKIQESLAAGQLLCSKKLRRKARRESWAGSLRCSAAAGLAESVWVPWLREAIPHRQKRPNRSKAVYASRNYLVSEFGLERTGPNLRPRKYRVEGAKAESAACVWFKHKHRL